MNIFWKTKFLILFFLIGSQTTCWARYFFVYAITDENIYGFLEVNEIRTGDKIPYVYASVPKDQFSANFGGRLVATLSLNTLNILSDTDIIKHCFYFSTYSQLPYGLYRWVYLKNTANTSVEQISSEAFESDPEDPSWTNPVFRQMPGGDIYIESNGKFIKRDEPNKDAEWPQPPGFIYKKHPWENTQQSIAFAAPPGVTSPTPTPPPGRAPRRPMPPLPPKRSTPPDTTPPPSTPSPTKWPTPPTQSWVNPLIPPSQKQQPTSTIPNTISPNEIEEIKIMPLRLDSTKRLAMDIFEMSKKVKNLNGKILPPNLRNDLQLKIQSIMEKFESLKVKYKKPKNLGKYIHEACEALPRDNQTNFDNTYNSLIDVYAEINGATPVEQQPPVVQDPMQPILDDPSIIPKYKPTGTGEEEEEEWWNYGQQHQGPPTYMPKWEKEESEEEEYKQTGWREESGEESEEEYVPSGAGFWEMTETQEEKKSAESPRELTPKEKAAKVGLPPTPPPRWIPPQATQPDPALHATAEETPSPKAEEVEKKQKKVHWNPMTEEYKEPEEPEEPEEEEEVTGIMINPEDYTRHAKELLNKRKIQDACKYFKDAADMLIKKNLKNEAKSLINDIETFLKEQRDSLNKTDNNLLENCMQYIREKTK